MKEGVPHRETYACKEPTLTSFELCNSRMVAVSAHALLIPGAKLSRVASDHDFSWAIPRPFTVILQNWLAVHLAMERIYVHQ